MGLVHNLNNIRQMQLKIVAFKKKFIFNLFINNILNLINYDTY